MPFSPGVLVVLLTIAFPRPPANPVTSAPQQPPPKPAQFNDDVAWWVEEHYDTIQLYQRGEPNTALQRLSKRTIAEQRRIAERVAGVLDYITKTGINVGSKIANNPQAQRVPRFDWSVATLPVAGSLHMEAALHAYRRNDASSAREISEQIRIAESFFGFYERQTGKPTASRRWQLAIGLTAMADGRFERAATVLDAACERFVEDGPLQLACGSIHETIAMLPADLSAGMRTARPSRASDDNPFTEFDESTANRYRGTPSTLGSARSAREAHLKRAVRAFEIALESDANNADAQLRLAHVRMMQDNDTVAARLLEPLAAQRAETPGGVAYLARLYLGDIRTRQRQLKAAATLLEEAITLLPSGRSAYLALARVARAEGNNDLCAAVLHRMMRAPTAPPDPWISVRFGQFWVPDALIAELRKEAAQQ